MATATKTRRTLATNNCMTTGRLNGNKQGLAVENKICNLSYIPVATKYVRTAAYKVWQWRWEFHEVATVGDHVTKGCLPRLITHINIVRVKEGKKGEFWTLFRCIKCKTSRYSRCFVPVAIRMLNAKWVILLSAGWIVLVVNTYGIHLRFLWSSHIF